MAELVKEQEWPDELAFSQAPFGYTVYVRKTEHSETCVTYQCVREGCSKTPFTVKVDPRDCSLDLARSLMRLHVDQSH